MSQTGAESNAACVNVDIGTDQNKTPSGSGCHSVTYSELLLLEAEVL
jgi:hypothetical protein